MATGTGKTTGDTDEGTFDAMFRPSSVRPQGSPVERLSEVSVSVAGGERPQGEVDEGVRRVLAEQRQGILQALSRVFLFAALPVLLGITLRELRMERVGIWFWLELAGMIAAASGASVTRLSMTSRGLLVTSGLLVASVASLVHFGPLLGTALLFAIVTLFAALLLSGSQAFIVTSLLVLSIYCCTYAVASGSGLLAVSELQLNVEQWLRLSATATAGMFTLLFILLKVQSNLWASLADQFGLRIRERKFVEEREKMLRTAGSVQRLESLGRLAGGIAHDFNNSLVVIQCGVGALEDDLSADEREEILGEVNDGVSRAAGTARQLLSFAKRNVEELGTCDPREVGTQLEKDAGRLLPAHISLEFKLPSSGEVPRVALSGTAIEQLLLVLVQNSREALGDQAGKVTVVMAKDPDGEGLLISVTDTGPGMPRATLERVWDPFFTTKGDRHAGLGLSTVWATVRRHGGEIQIDSTEGSGTTVSLTFLPAPEEQEAEAPVVAEPRSLKMSEMAVLVLEDEAPIRTALRRILKTTGLEVVEAATVAEARAAVASKKFSLLISDGVLPDGGVGEFIRDFGDSQKAPVILCSGYLEEDLALEGVARGQCSFLPKPFSADELSSLVRSLLSGASGKP